MMMMMMIQLNSVLTVTQPNPVAMEQLAGKHKMSVCVHVLETG